MSWTAPCPNRFGRRSFSVGFTIVILVEPGGGPIDPLLEASLASVQGQIGVTWEAIVLVPETVKLPTRPDVSDPQTNPPIDRPTNPPIDRQTDRPIDRQTPDQIIHWCFRATDPVSLALNEAIAQARGTWLVCLRAGDELAWPEALADCQAHWSQDPSLAGLITGWQWRGAPRPAQPWLTGDRSVLPPTSSNPNSSPNPSANSRPTALLDRCTATTLVQVPDLPLAALVVARSTLLRIGGFDELLTGAAVWDLVLRLVWDGGELAWWRRSPVVVASVLPLGSIDQGTDPAPSSPTSPAPSPTTIEPTIEPDFSEWLMVWRRWGDRQHQAELYQQLAVWNLYLGQAAAGVRNLGRSRLDQPSQPNQAERWLAAIAARIEQRGWDWDPWWLLDQPVWQDLQTNPAIDPPDCSDRPLTTPESIDRPASLGPWPPPRHTVLGCVFYRILGNDLPPRHRVGQTLENLQFILDHEPYLAGCEKRWVVNRMVDREAEAAILAVLDRAGAPYLHIPFDETAYSPIGFDLAAFQRPEVVPNFFASTTFDRLGPVSQRIAVDAIYRLKNLYVMNNNGARNAALLDGRSRGRWILPWDGNCFLDQPAWNALRDAIARCGDDSKYWVVPMARLLNNQDVLAPTFIPEPNEEPQIAFRCDAQEIFNPDMAYGRMPKVELLKRLNIPVPWDTWGLLYPWESPLAPVAPEAKAAVVVGWVMRLASGNVQSTTDAEHRYLDRSAGVRGLLNRLDEAIIRRKFSANRPLLYDLERLDRLKAAWQANNPDAIAVVNNLTAVADRLHTVLPNLMPNLIPDHGQTKSGPEPLHQQPRLGQTVDLIDHPWAIADRPSAFQALALLALAGYLAGRDRDLMAAADHLRSICSQDPLAWPIVPFGWSTDWTAATAKRFTPQDADPADPTTHQPGLGPKAFAEADDWPLLVEAARLIELQAQTRPEIWPGTDRDRLREWLRSRLVGLETSSVGRSAAARLDEIGTTCTLDRVAIALFLDDVVTARWWAVTSSLRPLPDLLPDLGLDPNRRTSSAPSSAPNGPKPDSENGDRSTPKPISGSIPMTAEAWHKLNADLSQRLRLARLSQAVGHDLWRQADRQGQTLADMLAIVAPTQVELSRQGLVGIIGQAQETLAQDLGLDQISP